MEIVLKKKPVVINTAIMLLAVCIQAIAKLFVCPKTIEYTMFKFISLYLIIIMFVYLYGVCNESFFILETFKGFYHYQLGYLIIIFSIFSVMLLGTDKLNGFVIEVDQRNFNLFKNMSNEEVKKRVTIILYSIEVFQLLYLIYSIYYYFITQKFIDDLKLNELKEYEEFRIMEQGMIAEIIEEDENRTFVNEDDTAQILSSDDTTFINSSSVEKSKSFERSFSSRNGH